MRIALSLLLVIGLVSGCVQTRPLKTATGTPEILIRTHERARIQRTLTQEMEARDYLLERRTEHWLVFTKPVEDFDMAFFHGPGWNASATFRVFCSFSETPKGTLISSQVRVVTGMGTPEEAAKPAPLGSELDHEVQEVLERTQGTVSLERHAEIDS